MKTRGLVVTIALALLALLAVEAGEAWARTRSGGSRGSRSYSAPARPAPMTPSRPADPGSIRPSPTSPQMAPARPGIFGGLMGGLTGFMLGGLLGGLLFGGLGHGFGFGLLDLLLVAGGIWLLFTLFRSRRSAPQPAYAGAGQAYAGAGQSAYGRVETEPAGTTTVASETPAGVSDLERGLGHIRQMDPGFDPSTAADETRRLFADLQGALGRRDMGSLRDRLTPEMHATLQAQCDQLRSARHSNRVERIDLRRAEVTEAWQETGRDYVTVYLEGSLIDYVVDDTSGRALDGSATTPVELAEYWTLTRPVGRNRWMLSAIQTG